MQSRTYSTRPSRTHIHSLVLVSLLSACGGGGGGGMPMPTVPNLASVPGAATVHNFCTSTMSANLSATDTTGNTYLLQVARSPGSGLATIGGATLTTASIAVGATSLTFR